MLKMKITRNQSVAAIATVIVAVCLLFSYLASDYGSDDGFRYEEAPGDYIALTIWNEDGDCSTHRVALISDEGDQSLYMIRTFGDIHRMLELDHGFITYVLYTVPDDAVPEGRETVFTSMGEFECDVLRDSNGDRYWVESHGMVLIHESTDHTQKVDSTSMAGIGTSESVSSRTDIRVDDFFAFKVSDEDDSRAIVYDVDSIDADGNYHLSVSRIDHDGVTTVERTVGYGELLGLIGFGDDYSGMEYVCEAVFTTSYGAIPCIVYDDGDIRYFVGVDDGLLYYCENDTYSYEVIGTSLVSDAPMDHYDGPQQDVGPNTMYMYSFTDTVYGLDEQHVDCIASAMVTVDSVDGYRVTCEVASYPDAMSMEYIGDYRSIWMAEMPNPMCINSIKVISTPMGNRLCAEYSDIHYVLHFIGLYDSVEYRSEQFVDDVYLVKDLTLLTTTEFTRDSSDPMNGDVWIYDAGDGNKVQMRQYVPGWWIYTDSEWESDFIPTGPRSDEYRETIDTVYGELECTRYTVDDVTVWLYEPLDIPMRIMFDDDGSQGIWDLEFSNLGVFLDN